ncbi:MAG: hypothetical protein SWY16_12620 [Cyanobacteriota bacterium]|nr:hypothetical protein [Cyanobacteriota bacterium]
MSRLQKIGGIAAFLNVAVAIAMFATAIVLIGPAAMSDPSKLAQMAVQNPAPLLVQDGLKFISVAISIVLILAIASYLNRDNLTLNSTLLWVATGFGFCSVLCLFCNATLSLYAISQASDPSGAILSLDRVNSIIGLLGLAALVLDGVWFLLISWISLKGRQLPKSLCYLGLGIGVLSLIPPLGIIVLLLGIAWSVWIGRVLLRSEPAG